jgi:hypothetical protein
MKRATQWLLLTLLIATTAACTRRARLYNLTTGEVSVVEYSYSGSGRGRISTVLASGERLRGEYVTVAGGQMEWGTIYASVYSPTGDASGSATSQSVSVEGKQRGGAIVTGDKGTIINCEYVTSVWNGAGTGACKDNKGTLYKLMF